MEEMKIQFDINIFPLLFFFYIKFFYDEIHLCKLYAIVNVLFLNYLPLVSVLFFWVIFPYLFFSILIICPLLLSALKDPYFVSICMKINRSKAWQAKAKENKVGLNGKEPPKNMSKITPIRCDPCWNIQHACQSYFILLFSASKDKIISQQTLGVNCADIITVRVLWHHHFLQGHVQMYIQIYHAWWSWLNLTQCLF